MRQKIDPQHYFDFSATPTRETQKYHARYDAISDLLDANPSILDGIQGDLEKPLSGVETSDCKGRSARFTADNVLRILIVMTLESMSLRRVVVQIDDSGFLRRFTRIHDKRMMCFSTLDKLKNCIEPVPGRSSIWYSQSTQSPRS